MPRRRPAVKFIRWLAKPSRPDTAGRPGRQKKFKKSASAFAGETNQVVGKVIPLVSFTRNWFSKEKKQCEPTLPLFFPGGRNLSRNLKTGGRQRNEGASSFPLLPSVKATPFVRFPECADAF
jgi:hypothetical protein